MIEAPRPKGRGFPVMYFDYIVPLDPGLKAGACGAPSGQIIPIYGGDAIPVVRLGGL